MRPLMIRTDSGGPYGLGHATRCRALARALASQGVPVTFTTTTPSLAALVAPFPCAVEGVPSRTSPATTALLVDTKAPDWATDEPWLCAYQRDRGPVIRIDHPTATPESCRLLILPGAHHPAGMLTGLRAGFGSRLLEGWSYVLLEDEVTTLARLPYAERCDGPLVFCAGGSDAPGVLRQMRHLALADERLESVVKLFCFGRLSGHRLGSVATWRGEDVAFSRQALRAAALVVGVFGQTAYECLWWGTPMVCFGWTAEDAAGSARLAQQSGGALQPGGGLAVLFGAWSPARFVTIVVDAWHNRAGRRAMATRAIPAYDGQGVARVATVVTTLLREVGDT